MEKKDNKKYWIIGIIAILIIYGGSAGWFKSIYHGGGDLTPNQYTPNQADTLLNENYYCCSSANGYSCSLNSCGLGGSKVYVDPFNSLSGCNTKCITPQQIQPPADQSLTCAQKAASLNALFYVNPVSTAKECMDFAVLDCQDTGKIIDGYGVSGTCCYYTCIGIVNSPQATCSDSDGGQDDQQFIKGVVTTSNTIYADECNWGTGGVTEYYCDGSEAKQTNIMCENYWTCQDGKCAQQLCEDIMSPSVEKCAAGYTTDGGTCAYWNTNGGECLSSFN